MGGGAAANKLSAWDMLRIARQRPGSKLAIDFTRGDQRQLTVLILVLLL